ncbi:MAG: 6-bladed beta-propeller [Acidobacteria bacterium]|nr:6-bladed beta-propeller [Acidobacteriota bacterium]
MLILFLVGFWIGEQDVALTLEPVPDTAESYLQNPGDICVDSLGRIHVLDLSAKTIFVWDAKGKFIGQYGSPGQGPGEFSFGGNMGGPQGYLADVGGTLFVYDGGPRMMSTFSKDLKFEKAESFLLESGRVNFLRRISADQTLVFYASFFSETPFERIAIYGSDMKPLKIFKEYPDETWHYTGSGNQRQVVLHIYGPSTAVALNQKTGEVIIGNSSKPSFDVFDMQGNLKQTVRVALSQKEVTKEDKDEWNENSWFKNQNFFKVEFPAEKAFYDQILPVGDRGYLVFLRSPNAVRCEGIYVDREGKTQKPFNLVCGNGGNMMGSMGRVFAVRLEEDEMVIQELKF